MPLTDAQIRTAKPKEKPYRLWDTGGLYLEITPTGSKLWRWKYRAPQSGKEKRLALGRYPDVPLASRNGIEGAREKRDAARKLHAASIDPGDQKKALKIAGREAAANSFEIVTEECLLNFASKYKKASTDRKRDMLAKYIFPRLGDKPIADITAADLLAALKKIDKPYTASRTLIYCSQVFRYAVSTERIKTDPTLALKGALTPHVKAHRAAITDPKQIGGLLRAIYDYGGKDTTIWALKLAPLTFVRPGELRSAKWADINFDEAEWNISAADMKMKKPHLVPLSKQALAILKELHRVNGKSVYVFPSLLTDKRPISNGTVLTALRRMGFTKDEMSGHGFRAMARTVMEEHLGIQPEYIEHQLAHTVRGPLGRAYNRTEHLDARRAMMQQWADYLDKLRNDKGAK